MMDPADKPQSRNYLCQYAHHAYLMYVINTHVNDEMEAALNFVRITRGLGWPVSYLVYVAEIVDGTIRLGKQFDITTSVKAKLVVEKPRGKKRKSNECFD